MRIEKILCPIDFSEPSEEALKVASEMASRLDAHLTLLHVFQVSSWPLPDGVVLPGPLRISTQMSRTDEVLEEWKERARQMGAVDVEVVSMGGSPWEEIVARARDYGYDLLVLGTHGRSGLRHLLMGSVAEQVLRHAPCPVLAVRPGVTSMEARMRTARGVERGGRSSR